jgi:hypothetical protein
MEFMVWDNMEIGIGYEWELKEHRALPSEDYDVNEQNYNSNGFFFSINYFTNSGMYLNSIFSYQWRRYPQSYTSDFISLYSDRNILSLMMMFYLPLTPEVNINMFLNFDNDLDVDYDQQDNQSFIFNAEIEYNF